MNVAKRKLAVITGGGPPAGGSPGASDWRALLTRNKQDRVEGSLHNVCLVLENDEHFAGMFWLNESSNQVLLNRDPPWRGGSREEFTDTDGCELAAWLQHPERYCMSVGADTALAAAITVARRHRRHPIREYLQGLQWDGVPRVERMLVDLFGTEDRPYNLRASQCFMVSAVARILWMDAKQPFMGAKVDFMLVLEGAQGKSKTTGLQTLFGARWYVETHESPSGKDFYQVIQGCWGVEIAEMDSFSKADVLSVKAAITRRSDKFRPPYDRMPRTFRRECVLTGTTNESEYLRDPTGGRRFLPARVLDDGVIHVGRIAELRDQLWAEAVAMFEAGFEWWVLPEDAEEEQERRYFGDSWEDRVARWLDMKARGDNAYPPRIDIVGRVDYTTTDEVLVYAIGLDAARHGRPEQMRISAIMKRLKWVNERVWLSNGPDRVRERRWRRASDPTAPAGGGDAPF